MLSREFGLWNGKCAKCGVYSVKSVQFEECVAQEEWRVESYESLADTACV